MALLVVTAYPDSYNAANKAFYTYWQGFQEKYFSAIKGDKIN
ncbi:MAG: hypothetical protein ACTS8H_00945 [Arsenophonus sp. NC-PE1-MAG3]